MKKFFTLNFLKLKATKILFISLCGLMVTFVACGGSSNDVLFLRFICGLAALDNDNFTVVGENGFSGYTQNGGTAFTDDSPGSTGNLTDAAVNNGITWTVGAGGMLYQKLSLTASYTNVDSGTTEDLNDLEWASTSVGFAVGNNGTVVRTTDAGINWTPMTISSSNLLSISCFNQSACWAVGSLGAAYKTEDSGISWTNVSAKLDLSYDLTDVYYSKLSSNNLWVIGDNGYFGATTNAGENFTMIDTGTNLRLHGLNFSTDESQALIAGNGFVGRYADGTVSEITHLFESGVEFKNVVRALSDRVFLMGTQGSLYTTTDYGQNVVKLPVIFSTSGVSTGGSFDDSSDSGTDNFDDSSTDMFDDSTTGNFDDSQTAAPTAGFKIDDQDFSFSHNVGQTSCPQKIGEFTITNDGQTDLTISISATGGTPINASPSSGISLAAGASVTIELYFNCSQTTSFNGTLNISGVNSNGNTATANVSVQGSVG